MFVTCSYGHRVTPLHPRPTLPKRWKIRPIPSSCCVVYLTLVLGRKSSVKGVEFIRNPESLAGGHKFRFLPEILEKSWHGCLTARLFWRTSVLSSGIDAKIFQDSQASTEIAELGGEATRQRARVA
jgi:hypothetical protein